MMYTQEWRELTEKMGYFVDLDNPYITYDNKYIETLWWLLKQFYRRACSQRLHHPALFARSRNGTVEPRTEPARLLP